MVYAPSVRASTTAASSGANQQGRQLRTDGRSVHECFHPGAFAVTPSAEVPILIDHDVAKRAGTVTVKIAHGGWHRADFLLDGPYAALRAELIARSGNVSSGFTGVDTDPYAACHRNRWTGTCAPASTRSACDSGLKWSDEARAAGIPD